jgi:hypothetical protein
MTIDNWITIIAAVIGIFTADGIWQWIKDRKKTSLKALIHEALADIKALKEADQEALRYRKKREEQERLEQASLKRDIELLKQAGAASLEEMLNENFEQIIGTDDHPGTGVYASDQRERYHFAFIVYVSLGYDGRMMSKWETLRTMPDEYGTVHPITDEERLQVAELKKAALESQKGQPI